MSKMVLILRVACCAWSCLLSGEICSSVASRICAIYKENGPSPGTVKILQRFVASSTGDRGGGSRHNMITGAGP